MPAYFSLSLQFQRNDIYGSFMDDFYAMLEQNGLRFKSGEREFENISPDEIIQWNQSKLEENFMLGYTQHFSHDYRQSCFDFCDFSVTRGFWLNNYPADGLFCYELIIPENDLLENHYPLIFKEEALNAVLELAEGIWQFDLVKAVQTALEADPEPAPFRELENGVLPNVRPFAITEDNGHSYPSGSFTAEKLSDGRAGLLFMLNAASKPRNEM